MTQSKNFNELRSILCDEIDKIREGKSTPANVNAVVNATGKIFQSVKMELEYYKLVGKKPMSKGKLHDMFQIPAETEKKG